MDLPTDSGNRRRRQVRNRWGRRRRLALATAGGALGGVGKTGFGGEQGSPVGEWRNGQLGVGLAIASFTGGEGGIRTPDGLAPMPHFECGAFNHSATSPQVWLALSRRGRVHSGRFAPWQGAVKRISCPTAAFALTGRSDSRNPRNEVVWSDRTAKGKSLCPSTGGGQGFSETLRSM